MAIISLKATWPKKIPRLFRAILYSVKVLYEFVSDDMRTLAESQLSLQVATYLNMCNNRLLWLFFYFECHEKSGLMP